MGNSTDRTPETTRFGSARAAHGSRSEGQEEQEYKLADDRLEEQDKYKDAYNRLEEMKEEQDKYKFAEDRLEEEKEQDKYKLADNWLEEVLPSLGASEICSFHNTCFITSGRGAQLDSRG